MVSAVIMIIITLTASPAMFVTPLSYVAREYGSMVGIGQAVSSVLRGSGQPDCAIFLIIDGSTSPHLNLYTEFAPLLAPMAIFEVLPRSADNSSDESELSDAVGKARVLRKLWWCVSVVVVSDDNSFLTSFAERSLRGRLLVWSTRLLVVTRLPFQKLRPLLQEHWTFSMMNAMVLNEEETTGEKRYSLYSYLPYTSEGPQVIRAASWAKSLGLRIGKTSQLFPEKFANFHGARVNVTALPYTPHWEEEVKVQADGTKVKEYGGTDYFLLSTIAEALNFSVHVLETESWDEVATKVEERVSFMATVFHNVLPQRLERYDYSYTYEYGSLDFSVAMPGLRPQWQSLYYPLSDTVWISILAVLVIVPLVLSLVNNMSTDAPQHIGMDSVSQAVFGMLMGQSVLMNVAQSTRTRLLVVAWLIFAFIIGVAYRGNLTAALTLPKYPSRVETLVQLVENFKSITMPPFGNEFIQFFRQSDSGVYKAIADHMYIVPSVMVGLQQAIDKREAHVAGRRYMEQKIAKHFTLPDGRSRLYVGRESLLPGISAWPIPHDAPYRPQLDWVMMAVIEAGLYEKWSEDMLAQARKESRQRQKDQQEEQENVEDTSKARLTALTIIHMQGPLMLLALGLLVALLTFGAELGMMVLLSRGKE